MTGCCRAPGASYARSPWLFDGKKHAQQGIININENILN